VKTLKIIFLWLLGVILVLQLVQIKIPPAPKATPQDEIKAPKEVMAILKRSCYDCHSNHTKMPWYGNISPVSIMVHSNIKNGRAWMNFSIWNRYDEAKKQKFYKGIYKAVMINMPPPEYLLIHKNAKLSKKDIKVLQEWAKSHIKEDDDSKWE